MTQTSDQNIDQKITGLYELVVELRDEMRQGFRSVDQRFANVDEQLAALRRDVVALRTDVDRLSERVEHFAGFAKEIDELRERVALLEKRSGLNVAAA